MTFKVKVIRVSNPEGSIKNLGFPLKYFLVEIIKAWKDMNLNNTTNTNYPYILLSHWFKAKESKNLWKNKKYV